MKQPSGGRATTRGTRAFTLIEMLLVIGIIGILAGMLFTGGRLAVKKRTLARATAELRQIAAAIEDFKSKYNYYPPDNPNNTLVNPLYYELAGVSYTPTNTPVPGSPDRFDTLDKRTSLTAPQAFSVFGVSGFVNAAHPGKAPPKSPFQPRGNQVAKVVSNTVPPTTFEMLIAPGKGTNGLADVDGKEINPWRYQSTAPAHNTRSFDLWADIEINDQVFRVCNWNNTPQLLYSK
ncbi:MAG: type II secretion system protein [Verrucomicrobiota bacterium]